MHMWGTLLLVVSLFAESNGNGRSGNKQTNCPCGPLSPCGPGPYGRALMGQALIEPPWALMGVALMGRALMGSLGNVFLTKLCL